MHETQRLTLRTYVWGYATSLITTLIAYLLVEDHVHSRHAFLTHHLITVLITGLALVQFVLQLVFFLHLGRETSPRWKLWVFVFMVVIVAILVFGSLWIMQHLDYHMQLMPQDTNSMI